jgi:peptide/nickel transport system substrate-binding protein
VVKAQNWVATAILMNPKPGTILADANVRNAIRWGIDYNSIIKDILKDYAIPLDRAFWRPFLGSMKDGTEPLYKYDPAKAKEFMAKSGFPSGGEFTIEIGTGGGFGAPWEVIAGKEASDLAKLGLKMNLNQSDWSVVDEKSVNGDYQAMQIWTGTFVNEAAGHIMSHVYPGKAFFMAKNAYANKRLEELGDTVLRETDPGKRLAAIDEINKIEAEDGPYAWVAQKLATYVFPKNLAGFDGYPGPYQFDYAVLHYK